MSSSAASIARQRVGYRVLPVLAAFDNAQRLAEIFFLDLLLEAGGFVLAQRDDDLADWRRSAANLRKVCTRMGVPCSSKNCLLLLFGPPESRGHSRAQSGGGNDDNNFHIGQPSINGRTSPIQIAESNRQARA